MLAFYVPFTVLAIAIARLPWKRIGLWALYAELTVMALVFAVVGFYQYETRNVFENPKVIYSNAYAAFFRVNSVFWDPSVYGRFLVVAMIPSVVLIVRGRSPRIVWAAAAALVVIWFGLLISFSQSSFAALLVAVIGVAFVAWRWRALLAVGLAVVVLGGLAVAQPTVRRSIEHHTKSGLNSASSGRYSLVANGIRIAVAHPVRGVGVGGFQHAYAKRVQRLHGKKNLKTAASHDTPVTVAAETGFVGFALFVWLRGRVRLRRGADAASRAVSRPGSRWPRSSSTRSSTATSSRTRRRGCCSGSWRSRCRPRRAGGAAAAVEARGGGGVIEQLEAGARPGAAHRRRRVRVRWDDGAARRGRVRGSLCRVLDRDALAAGGLPAGHARRARCARRRRELGIPEERLTVHDFDVRTFPERRQEILELLVAMWEDWKPEVVFQPSLHDIHQDHQTIAQEGLRAFKRTTILGYEIPWNNFDFAYQWYVSLDKRHVERKVAALEKYASQQHRRYASPEYVWNVARTHGINVNREYAEVFQVYRVIT